MKPGTWGSPWCGIPGRRKAVGNDYFRPLFDVADNSVFIPRPSINDATRAGATRPSDPCAAPTWCRVGCVAAQATGGQTSAH